MSDWRETKESQEQDVPQRTAGEKLASQGISSIQGNVDAQGSEAREAAKQPDNTDDFITARRKKSPEFPPQTEGDGTTVKVSQNETEGTEDKIEPPKEGNTEGKIKPPKDWYSGGPERGG
jgi:hypothetical protein